MHAWPFLCSELGQFLPRVLGSVREDKAVAIDPIGVLGIESHELVEEDVGHRGHAHRGAGMAGICFEGGIDLEFIFSSALTRQQAQNALASRCLGKIARAG